MTQDKQEFRREPFKRNGQKNAQNNHRLPIEAAVEFLKPRLKEIDKVKDWAEIMGYDNSAYFSDLFRDHFGERPKLVMDRIKLERAIQLLSDQPEMKCYTVALEIGKKNEHILNHFFNRMTGFPPNDFRTEKSDRKK